MTRKLYSTLSMLMIAAFLLSGCAGSSASRDPQPTPGDQSGSPLQITLADNGRTVSLKSGQSFLLFLGEGYDWTLSISDQNVISREKNIATIVGSQGVFDALQAGESVLSASGDPTCRTQQPACMQPSIQFQVTIQVN
jgi:predicted secreted protein